MVLQYAEIENGRHEINRVFLYHVGDKGRVEVGREEAKAGGMARADPSPGEAVQA